MDSCSWGQTYWNRTYQIHYSAYRKASVEYITATSDGNFIAAGNVIVKISPFGDTLWTQKVYPPPSDTSTTFGTFCAITPLSDSNFLLAGTLSSSTGTSRIIQKITPDGAAIWERELLESSYPIESTAIAPTADGNFIITGSKTVKISATGEVLWIKDHGMIRTIAPTSDGNFIIAGYKSNNSHVNFTYLKISPSGTILWEKDLYPANPGDAYAIVPAGNNQFILGGLLYSETDSIPDPSAVFIKIASNGDIVWMKRYGVNKGYDLIKAITPTRDGNFFAVGFAGGDDYFLKIKSNGDTLWTKTIHSNSTIFLSSVAQTSDGNFIVPGYSENISFRLFIDDRYATKNSPFTFKIPVPGDSLNFGYTPLAVPSGMSISKGGSISWTPTFDSVYIQNVKYLISDDYGTRDTLTFNILVNYQTPSVKALQTRDYSITKNLKLTATPNSSTGIKFALPSCISKVKIYNMEGKCIRSLHSDGTEIIWNTQNEYGASAGSGHYIAEVISDNLRYTIPFSVIR
jgi:hypothetical protein